MLAWELPGTSPVAEAHLYRALGAVHPSGVTALAA
jgi:hypothetical protein